MRLFYNIKFIITTIAVLLATSVSGQDQRVASIEFNKKIHDFGDIQLSAGKQNYTFTFKNISQQPVIIQTVISSCGCTTPTWTKNPVQPGESGKLSVTFLNDQGPIPFDKSLTVYVTGSPKPIILRLKGVVHAKKKSIKQLFPVLFGAMALRKSPIDVGQINQGTIDHETVEIANISSSPIKVTFTDLSKGLSLTVTPETLAPGSKGNLMITIDTKVQKNWGLTSYVATPVINGKKASKKFEISATIREDFSDLNKTDIDQAPLPMASRSSLNFGTISSGNKIDTIFEIKNLGRKDLLIHKIDLNEKGVEVANPGKISPGASAKINVKINTAGQFGEKIYILTLITNSPTRPIINLLLSGEITK
ncbi:MAG: DUF1573 domain-containing protein [Bacteroidales bacterium]|jgi:hypothetical protein